MAQAFFAADTRVPLRDWTVADLLDDAVARAPDAVALKQSAWEWREDGVWTHDALREDARRLGRFLLDQFQPGEPVAIWAANSAQWTLYQLAAGLAGLTLVTFNPALREREIQSLLARSRAAGVIVDPLFRGTDPVAIIETLRATLPHLRAVLRTDQWRAHLNAAPSQGPTATVKPDDPAMMLYTSGTTGQPKGVVLRHRGIVNNAICGAERFGLEERQVWFGTLPCFHVGGSVYSTLACLSRLGTNVVAPAFDPGEILRLIETERVAWMPIVPPMAIALIEHPRFETTDLSSLQLLSTGGTIITPDFVRLLRERFGADVQVMFGQTEGGGGICKTLRSDPDARLSASAGRPYPHTALRIADSATGRTLDTGQAGEIMIRSPFMTDGYHDDPEATRAAFDADGFLRTGDIGVLDDDGYVQITGRLKEMIIRGGENLYPREIEDALGDHPEVLEAAVVGAPDPRWGEVVAAAVRCAAGSTIEPEALREFLLTRLARHKVPTLWKRVDDFPRTPSGKIQKFEVRAWFAAEAAQTQSSTIPPEAFSTAPVIDRA